MYAIKTKKLTKKYGSINAVNELDLEIIDGELFALLGVNGAGKTTLVKMLSTISSPTEGEAFVGGFNILTDGESVRKIIAVSPQETAIAPNLSVRENLELICGIHGFSKEKSEKRIAEMSDGLKLGEVLTRRACKLSGGFQRRLSIAMALISEPKILFLDEPTLGIDVIARSELWDIIRSLKGKVTIVLTTHYMEEAQMLSDRIGVMKNGKMLFVGSAEQIMERMGEDRFENAFIKMVREGGL